MRGVSIITSWGRSAGHASAVRNHAVHTTHDQKWWISHSQGRGFRSIMSQGLILVIFSASCVGRMHGVGCSVGPRGQSVVVCCLSCLLWTNRWCKALLLSHGYKEVPLFLGKKLKRECINATESHKVLVCKSYQPGNLKHTKTTKKKY